MRLVYDKSFLKSVQRLPKAQQRKLASLLEHLQENPFHPLLHSKHLSGDLAGLLSFRITREWRVIFLFQDPSTIHLLRAEHRKDIYR